MSVFLEIRDLGFAWPRQAPLFAHLNASLAPGLALLTGDEQRGKSTLLRLLAGEIRPQAGTLRLGGQDIGEAHAGLRPNMTRPDLDPVIVADWLRGQVPQGPARDRLEAHIDGLSLGEHLHKGFYMLSAGGRRKVGLAAAMALQPPLTLLDQPFSALDLASIRCLTGWLREQSQITDRLVLLADYKAPADLAISQRIDLG
ncbi:ABC transporter ATP-binding protein [Hydrogenophaga pseudoflava]|uniref:ABC transporter ATP-binding protein n=1 Tax=Hydrogenophaga pseudoflava TaxID=47421 RepID=UPI0027E3FCB9|nr:ATP-binding cassette domain-containing protein [Hydrogenophaga pseudoflava]MDQ7746468.1 ATP-binding cassette domain-containing protein [Hydrogenophaga pseudoflava]